MQLKFFQCSKNKQFYSSIVAFSVSFIWSISCVLLVSAEILFKETRRHLIFSQITISDSKFGKNSQAQMPVERS